jgi:hypothetical protein
MKLIVFVIDFICRAQLGKEPFRRGGCTAFTGGTADGFAA